MPQRDAAGGEAGSKRRHQRAWGQTPGERAFEDKEHRRRGHVFGRRLNDVWNEWIAYEHEYQKANLARLAQYPLTETVKLSPKGLGSMSRGYVDEKTNSLIAAFRYPGTIGFIGRMDLATGKLTKLQEIKGMEGPYR